MTEARKSSLSLVDVATGVVVVAIAVLAAWTALRGPTGPIPTHLDISGRPDRYGDRSEVAAIFGFMALLAGLISGGMGWGARTAADPARRRGLALGQGLSLLAIGGATAFMAAGMLADATDGTAPSPAWLALGLSLLMIAIGAGLGRVAPNPVIGVRTPWTYKSRLAWDRSNRLAGRLLFWLGVGGLAVSPFIPGVWATTGITVGVLIAALWSVVESWRVWRRDPDRQPF